MAYGHRWITESVGSVTGISVGSVTGINVGSVTGINVGSVIDRIRNYFAVHYKSNYDKMSVGLFVLH